ncbi:EthD family reductase [Sphingosinicella rhizophila]|uniref:EthD family reductase n=1 Tax=Sphingosinicella rhizophila TaxID=3050082 RepID=A0ABU3QBP8_9SPHN|nr:EthD family reductase [Sphingosinicella sp. GR2756]MDT9600803.1 EthD family reductase [Sphingosinicella sp. GR2756]
MATISVIYPQGEQAEFDFEYYQSQHLPLLTQRWGPMLAGVEALRGTATPDGREAPYLAIALLRFTSIEALKAATGGEHAAEIFADIPKFTNVRPIVQINEQVPYPARPRGLSA